MKKLSVVILLSSFSLLAQAAERTVEISLHDNYFEPESITVAAGETVRFSLNNQGNLLHQFTIGSVEMHTEQQAEMAMMMEHGMLTDTGIDEHAMHMDHSSMGMGEMSHDAPNTALIEPGQSAELVWTFSTSGTLEFACNLPGRYDVGMVGSINIAP